MAMACTLSTFNVLKRQHKKKQTKITHSPFQHDVHMHKDGVIKIVCWFVKMPYIFRVFMSHLTKGM